ncbi:DUF3891 family protein [Lentibacillus sediminis]|uniref:DUF3891 family protein n=1 Tax=Lentibacillus sediminis TaxID=1940529 RepID=UPI000C1BE7ED|nr:DUF3891 family protein [Lentibacillus sediminis]
MIVRERADAFVMIEQDDHAKVSGELIKQWNHDNFLGSEWRKSVEYAVDQHDIGWKPFDQQPFWNDEEQAPYTFANFPTLPKIVLYTYGIDVVEKEDPYAALLCSEHYKRFLLNNTSEEAQAFVQQEEARQQRLISSLDDFNKRLFNFHYAMVQLGDNLSLYLCLNEPGAKKEEEHPFFREGIPIPTAVEEFNQEKIQLWWEDDRTVMVEEYPLDRPVTVKLRQRVVSRAAIRDAGLISSYEEAEVEDVLVEIRGVRG